MTSNLGEAFIPRLGGGFNPIVGGLYAHNKDFPIKGGITIPNMRSP